MRRILIALLLASAAAAEESDIPGTEGMEETEERFLCDEVFDAVDAACATTAEYDMDQCFERCMEESDVSLDEGDRPACPELSGALCACSDLCAHSEDCKHAMYSALNCEMDHQFGCKGYACGTSSVVDEGEL